jgi:hypothetical protein
MGYKPSSVELALLGLNLNGNKYYWLFSVALIFFLLTTANLFSYDSAIANGYSDIISYIKIATTLDYTEFRELSNHLPLHHVERWPTHLLIGWLSQKTDIEIWLLYRIGVLLCLVLSIYTIEQLKAATTTKIVFLTVVLLSPYTFRQYLSVPAMISDCLFYVAIIGSAVGVFNKNLWLIVGYSALACLVRQTGILLIPIIIFYCLINRVRLTTTISILGLFLFINFIIKTSTQIIFIPNQTNYVLAHALGIFYWLGNEPLLSDFLNFTGRYILMLLTLSPLLILYKPGQLVRWSYIAFFLLFTVQPLLGGPIITGPNIDRLAIYGLPFLCLLFLEKSISIKEVMAFTILIILNSFQPQFSLLNFFTSGRYYFLTLVLTVSFISVYIWLITHRARQIKLI